MAANQCLHTLNTDSVARQILVRVLSGLVDFDYFSNLALLLKRYLASNIVLV